MPIVVSPWEIRFKNHTIFGKTAKEALSHAKEEIERCEAKGISWELYCKSPQEVAIEESYNKGWDAGSDSGYELGRLSIFEKQLKIKMAVWSLCVFNGKDWSLGDKEITDYLISSDKPIKIIYGYDFLDVDNYEKRDYLVGKAKNGTIGEIWKGIDRMMVKNVDCAGESMFGDHRFIESITYKDDQIVFDTGS
tara:strand:+ start:312 stop:890 length:579 start_codon:yes stop_codon:yes gene_type:complete